MPLALYLVAFIGAALAAAALQRRRRAAMLPPGPPGDPLIGHLLRMPSTDPALVFHQWAKIYGPIMHLKVLGRSMIILDSYQAAVDLLDKRGLIYSDRPKFTLYELFGWMPVLGFARYGSKTLGIQRQMHQSYLGRHRIADFKPMQTHEARSLVQNLFESPPAQYEKLMSRFSSGIITQIVAGHRITSDDDPYIQISNEIYDAFAKTGLPGSSPLDLFPLCGATLSALVSRSGAYAFCESRSVCNPRAMGIPSAHGQGATGECSAVGEALPCFIRDQLEQMEDSEDEEQLKGAAANIFAAGELTTWSALTIFVIAMVLHPESQAKAQKEIDLVVGDMRLPEFLDREHLPFVEGILQETLRWLPSVPMG
ncbi:Cytochrome P450 [Mycena sanguinolenta]|uniref:Cytochrome P450 n=1 Tax=Mycena sanguinolenta TaxID=230812 RepID=A0A8H7CM90_9AGAR|nr:Cytochrome P450 [Mycena sanguinolenta]